MIYICVLNYNNASDTVDCLESLRRLQGVEYRILLVDNASPDGSGRVLQEYADRNPDWVKFFGLAENCGYAAGNNVALRWALEQPDMEYCWILNNDTTVEPDALQYLVEYMESHPVVGLCGSKMVYSWDRSRIQGYGGSYSPWLGVSASITDAERIGDIDYVIGAAVFVRRSFLETVGLMCEDYFLYYEELDWAMRAKGKFEIACEPRSVVYHKEGAAIGANAAHPESKSAFADYYGMRNRLLFTRKFYPQYLPTVYLSSIGMLWNRFKRHQYDRIWTFIKLLLGVRDARFEHKK